MKNEKAKKVTYCIFLICLVLSSSFAFPLTSSQSYAQASKGTCESALQNAVAKKPTVWYARTPMKVGSDNKYFVFVYKPDDFTRNIELNIEGVQNWSVEGSDGTNVMKSGNKIIVKSSGSFVIKGSPSQSSCYCKDSPQGMSHCSSGCVNFGQNCDMPNTQCYIGPGLKLTVENQGVEYYYADNAEDLLGMILVSYSTASDLANDDFDSYRDLVYSFLAVLAAQFRQVSLPLVFDNYVNIAEVDAYRNILPIGNGKYSATQAIELFHKNFPSGYEGYGMLFVDSTGKVKLMLDVSKDPGYNPQPLRQGITAEILRYYSSKMLNEQDLRFVGLTHSQPKSGLLSLMDVLAGENQINLVYENYNLKYGGRIRVPTPPDFYVGAVSEETQAYSYYRFDTNTVMQIRKIFQDKFGLDDKGWFIKWPTVRDKYGQERSFSRYPLEEVPEYAKKTWGITLPEKMGIIEKAVIKVGGSTPGGFESIRVQQLKIAEQMTALEFVWNIKTTIENQLTKSEINPDYFRDIKAYLDKVLVEKSVNPTESSLFYETLDYTKKIIDLGIKDTAQARVEIVKNSPKLKIAYYEFLLDVEGTTVNKINQVSGYSPIPAKEMSVVEDAAKRFIDKNEPTEKIMKTRTSKIIAEALGGKSEVIDPMAVAVNKYGNKIFTISITIAVFSDILRDYGETIHSRHLALFADVTQKFAIGEMIAQGIITTAALEWGVNVVPQALRFLIMEGATKAAIAAQMVYGFVVIEFAHMSALMIYCGVVNPTSKICGCIPDSFYGKPQLELEKNVMSPDEKINFAIYGMEGCDRTIGRIETLKEIEPNKYQTDKTLGDCDLKEYTSGSIKIFCCQGQIGVVYCLPPDQVPPGEPICTGKPNDVKLNIGSYKVVGSIYPFSSDFQQLHIIKGMTCYKENENSWVCIPSIGNIKCTQNTQSSWTCSVQRTSSFLNTFFSSIQNAFSNIVSENFNQFFENLFKSLNQNG